MTLWRVDRNVIQRKWQCTGNSKNYMYLRTLFLEIICLLDFQVLFGPILFPKGLPWRWSTSVVVHSSLYFFSDSSLCSSSNYGSAGSGERCLPSNSHFVLSIAKPDCPWCSWCWWPFAAFVPSWDIGFSRSELHVQISGRVDTVHNRFNLSLFHTM